MPPKSYLDYFKVVERLANGAPYVQVRLPDGSLSGSMNTAEAARAIMNNKYPLRTTMPSENTLMYRDPFPRKVNSTYAARENEAKIRNVWGEWLSGTTVGLLGNPNKYRGLTASTAAAIGGRLLANRIPILGGAAATALAIYDNYFRDMPTFNFGSSSYPTSYLDNKVMLADAPAEGEQSTATEGSSQTTGSTSAPLPEGDGLDKRGRLKRALDALRGKDKLATSTNTSKGWLPYTGYKDASNWGRVLRGARDWLFSSTVIGDLGGNAISGTAEWLYPNREAVKLDPWLFTKKASPFGLVSYSITKEKEAEKKPTQSTITTEVDTSVPVVSPKVDLNEVAKSFYELYTHDPDSI